MLDLIDQISVDLNLNVVGVKKKIYSKNKKVKFFLELNSLKKVINAYDLCNIFILPSYTEGSPKVILESLARQRPIIIFEEIKHVQKISKEYLFVKGTLKIY